MHDNLGAQLLSALYSPAESRKNTLIREAISDLRDIVNNAATDGQKLDDLLTDLRLETLERLVAAGMSLEWHIDHDEEAPKLEPRTAHALRSVLRELVSNAMRHSQGRNLAVQITHTGRQLQFRVSDDGKGLGPDRSADGNGLSNIKARLLALGCEFTLTEAAPGLSAHGWIMLDRELVQ